MLSAYFSPKLHPFWLIKRSKVQSLFGVHKIPSDNHIRDLLDPAKPKQVFPVFEQIFQKLDEEGYLDDFRSKEKQDCENTAAKRWLLQHGQRYTPLRITF